MFQIGGRSSPADYGGDHFTIDDDARLDYNLENGNDTLNYVPPELSLVSPAGPGGLSELGDGGVGFDDDEGLEEAVADDGGDGDGVVPQINSTTTVDGDLVAQPMQVRYEFNFGFLCVSSAVILRSPAS